MTEETTESNLYKFCECGQCNEMILKFDSRKRPMRFKYGHNTKGFKHYFWKGGRIKASDYWKIWIPTHPNADSKGYVFEHRLIMEQFLGRYLTKTEQIHHINGNRTDNNIDNLMLFPNHAEHKKYEMTIDMSGRYCLLCKSKNTAIQKRNGRPNWFKYQDGFICQKCYSKSR